MLSRGDDDLLRHVALELRRCLEAVVYEKLWAYRDRIPPDVPRKWQPPQAFKALLRMEPDAEETSTVCVAAEREPGVPSGPSRTLGVDHRPGSGWLKKTYNKLGSLLHARSPFARPSEQSGPNLNREYLEGVISELQPFVERSLTVTLAVVSEFDCSVCRAKVKANVVGLERVGEVWCLNCDCRFFAVKEGDDFTFHLDTSTLACSECKQQVALPAQKLAHGYRFSCPGCGCEFEITDQVWQFRRVNQVGNGVEVDSG